MKKIMSKKGGFTLIEILVVVAIIGLLAAVILVSVSSARTKASNAAIKINLKKIVAVIGSDQIENNGSSLACPGVGLSSGNNDLDNACSSITKAGGSNLSVLKGTGSVAASATLTGSSGTWCVDTAGKEGAGTAGTSAGVVGCQ